jgi:Dyp-type peroxidase family
MANYLIVGIALAAILFITWLRFRLYGKAHDRANSRSGSDGSTGKSKCPYTRTLEMLGLRKRGAKASGANASGVGASSNADFLNAPIDAQDEAVKAVLADLQCNILTGHGRANARFLFVKLDPAKIADARKFIADFARNHVTSAQKQKFQRKLWRDAGIDGGLVAHVAISSSGYRKLGYSEASLPQGSDPFARRKTTSYRNVFADGMKGRRQYLLDAPVGDWDNGYQDDIDLMILIADDDAAALDKFTAEVSAQVAAFGSVAAQENGKTVHRKFDFADGEKELGVEHFGYVDGRSQPLLLKEEVDGEAKVGDKVWQAEAPAKLVLVQDSLAGSASSYGSFLVFRKLEQNVRAFHRARKDLGSALGVTPDLAGAMAVGRHEDGTPVLMSDKSGIGPVNDFDFAADGDGLKCPFQSHIRKTNPRGEAVGPKPPLDKTVEGEKLRRIARRGIPYGGDLTIEKPEAELPEGGLGLLFFCYQSDILEQFEFIQRVWANNPFFLEPAKSGKKSKHYDVTGLDPLIGQSHPTSPGAAQPARNWPSAWGQPTTKCPVDFAGFVKMRGGEYFFSPSITFLTSLDKTA